MTGPARLYEACRASLVSSLTSVAEHCPDVPAASPLLARLRDLVRELAAAPPDLSYRPDGEITIDEALALLSTSQGLLLTLRGPSDGERINGETHQALAGAIACLEARLGAHLRQQLARRVRGLYVIISPETTNGRDPLRVAEAAVRGGARMLQLRDKTADKGDILSLARGLQQLCRTHDVDLIINDHADVAAVAGSAGMHVGQTDLPVAEARRVLSPRQVVGRSNHELPELEQSQEMGADHLAFGPIYATSTKGVGRPPQGVDRLRLAIDSVRVPLVAIGGINAQNAAPVVEAGADAICVTAAVGAAAEPEAAAAGLVNAIHEAGGRV